MTKVPRLETEEDFSQPGALPLITTYSSNQFTNRFDAEYYMMKRDKKNISKIAKKEISPAISR